MGRNKQQPIDQEPATYGDFTKENTKKIARSLNMPWGFAAVDPPPHNYSMVREMAREKYFAWRSRSRYDLERSKIVVLPEGWSCQELASPYGREHVDPMKEAKGQATRLASLTTTLAAEYAKQGKDWEVELEQLAREAKRMKELGLTPKVTPVPSRIRRLITWLRAWDERRWQKKVKQKCLKDPAWPWRGMINRAEQQGMIAPHKTVKDH